MRKFRNVPIYYNGRLYDSKKEAKHAGFLDMCRRAEKPSDRVVLWLPQVSFRLSTGNRIIVDFVVLFADQRWEIHEVKSKPTKTPLYKLKKRLFEKEYGIEIKEV